MFQFMVRYTFMIIYEKPNMCDTPETAAVDF